MALTVSGMPRVFTLNSRGEDIRLTDLNPKGTPEEIKRLYSDQYPELLSATITGPTINNNEIIYKFSPKAGTKG